MELIARVKESTRNGIVKAVEMAKGKTPEEIKADRNAWLADLGHLPEWEQFIMEQYNNIL